MALRAGRPPENTIVCELVTTCGTDSAIVLLEVLAADREASEHARDTRVELVWSGPEEDGAATRDTAIVVRDLFRTAQRSVLVSGYVVYDGASIFEVLWERWQHQPELDIELYLNVSRPGGDTSPADTIVSRFRERFYRRDWPWTRRPRVFYDPRAIALGAEQGAVLHAKCVVVDGARALVTSANLTAAAQYRNIEAGLLVNDANLAQQLAQQFKQLVQRGQLLEL